MTMLSEQVKHLELIQSVVSRMAGNSFLLKGWSVTLGVALLGLGAKDENPKFALLAVFPPMIFWAADAYYVRQERLFRKLYDRIRKLCDTQWAEAGKFDMSTKQDETNVPSWKKTAIEPLVCGVHLSVVALVLVVLIFVCWLR